MQRREFMWLVPASLTFPRALFASEGHPFRIRTVTAGIPVKLESWQQQFQEAADFLKSARSEYQDLGYEVQTLRISTQALPDYLPNWTGAEGWRVLAEIDECCEQLGGVLRVVQLINS